MEQLFVNVDIQKLLEEKGFKYVKVNMAAPPLYQQVVDWFREKHKILINIEKDTLGSYYGKIINDYDKVHKGSGNHTYFDNDISISNDFKGFKTYYEAFDRAIEEAIKLI